MDAATYPPPHEDFLEELFQRSSDVQPGVPDNPPVLLVGGNYRALIASLAEGLVAGLELEVISLAGPADEPPSTATADLAERLSSRFGEALHPWVVRWLTSLSSMGEFGNDLFDGWSHKSDDDLGAADLILETLDAVSVTYGRSLVVLGDLTTSGGDFVLSAVQQWFWKNRHEPSRVLAMAGVCRGTGQDDPLLNLEDRPVGLLAAVDGLRQADRASWTWLPALNDERLNSWLGRMAPAVSQRLAELSGGDDLNAAELWKLWSDSGYVTSSESTWVFSEKPEPFGEEIRSLLESQLASLNGGTWADNDPVRKAQEVMELGALGGETFSGSGVAAAVVREEPELLSEDIHEILDVLGARDSDRRLLESDAEIADAEGALHQRYRFKGPLLASYLRGIGSTEERLGVVPPRVMAERIYDSAIEAHGLHAVFDKSLQSLAAEVGSDEHVYLHDARLADERWRAHLHASLDLHLPADIEGVSVGDLDPLANDSLIRIVSDLTAGGEYDLALRVGEALRLQTAEAGDAHQEAAAAMAYGQALTLSGRYPDAQTVLRHGVQALQGLLADAPESRLYKRDLAANLTALGVSLRDGGRPEDSSEPLGQAITIFEELVESDEHPELLWRDLAVCRKDKGLALASCGDYDESVEVLELAVAAMENLYAWDRSSPGRRRELAVCLSILAFTLRDAGRVDDSEKSMLRAIELTEALLEENPNSELYRNDLAGMQADVIE